MSGFPWLPLGTRLPHGTVGRLSFEGPGYQVVEDRMGQGVHLLLESNGLAATGVQRLLGPAGHPFEAFGFGGKNYLVAPFRSDEVAAVHEVPKRFGLPTSGDVTLLAASIKRVRAEFPDIDVGSALLVRTFGALPTQAATSGQDLRALALDILLAGTRVARTDVESIRSINSSLTPHEIENFLAEIDPGAFALPGRPELERFLRDYILEPARDPTRYAALKVAMPNGVLLHGPTGSGKSHAVAKLVAALGWPVIELNLGKLGSPLAHQVTLAIRGAFDEARRSAPAVVAIEEIRSLGGQSRPIDHDYKVEEVSELLRMVEGAATHNILVIATTNRIDALDLAMRRKGRFDHVVEVGYPDADEVHAVLRALLDERPHRDIQNLREISVRLAGRPMSDVVWVVNEAARIAARAGKEAIDDLDLLSALKNLKRDRNPV